MNERRLTPGQPVTVEIIAPRALTARPSGEPAEMRPAEVRARAPRLPRLTAPASLGVYASRNLPRCPTPPRPPASPSPRAYTHRRPRAQAQHADDGRTATTRRCPKARSSRRSSSPARSRSRAPRPASATSRASPASARAAPRAWSIRASTGPNQEILEDRLAIWDGAEEALCFSSGMTAICVLMLAFCSAGDVIVHSGPLYAASEGFVAKHTEPLRGRPTSTSPPAPTAPSSTRCWRKAQGAGRRAGRQGGDDLPRKPGQPDQRAGRCRGGARRARRGARRRTARSRSTTPSSARCGSSPLDHGADIVVYSLTKYVGGHSDLVAGSVSGAKRWIDPAAHAAQHDGRRSPIPTPRGCCCAASRRSSSGWSRAGENAAKVCDYPRRSIPRSRASAISG